MYYSLSNLVFSDERKFFILEEFLFLILNKEINCKYIYLSNEMFCLYEKNVQKSQNSSSSDQKSILVNFENKYEKLFDNNPKAFLDSKRKYYDEYMMLLENNYNDHFKFCLKIKYFLKFLIKSQFVQIDNLAVFVFLKEQKFQIESGKNFGFDYLLYKQAFEDKDLHLHSPYAVSIVKGESELSYIEILGKLRIAKNYGKVYFIFVK